MHNHLIPGIDDGSTDLESSIVMIRAMYELGYRKFVATPHVQWEMFKNTHEIIENGQTAAGRWTATATHRGEHLGVRATNNSITINGMSFLRTENGQITEG